MSDISPRWWYDDDRWRDGKRPLWWWIMWAIIAGVSLICCVVGIFLWVRMYKRRKANNRSFRPPPPPGYAADPYGHINHLPYGQGGQGAQGYAGAGQYPPQPYGQPYGAPGGVPYGGATRDADLYDDESNKDGAKTNTLDVGLGDRRASDVSLNQPPVQHAQPRY